MARVDFTRHLHRFFPSLAGHGSIEIEAGDVAELVARLEVRFPGMGAYLVDDRRALRQHVNVFVNGAPVRDRLNLSDPLDGHANVQIIQALSGG